MQPAAEFSRPVAGQVLQDKDRRQTIGTGDDALRDDAVDANTGRKRVRSREGSGRPPVSGAAARTHGVDSARQQAWARLKSRGVRLVHDQGTAEGGWARRGCLLGRVARCARCPKETMNKAIDPALMQAAEVTASRWTPTGCRSPPTASSRRRRGCWPARRACTTATTDGRQILDGVAGLWCVNAGHARPRSSQAIQNQAAELDFAPPFQMAHPKAFELAERLVDVAPEGLHKVFFTNSGSESVETALKMALAYHRVRGDGTRTRLLGRARAPRAAGRAGSRSPRPRRHVGPGTSGAPAHPTDARGRTRPPAQQAEERSVAWLAAYPA